MEFSGINDPNEVRYFGLSNLNPLETPLLNVIGEQNVVKNYKIIENESEC